MANKALVGGLSAILLVAVVVGVIAGVTRSTHKAGSDFTVPEASPETLSTSTKAVTSLCAPTDYRDVCEKTLTNAAKNNNSTQAMVKAAVETIVNEVKQVYEKSKGIGGNAQHPVDKAAVENCKALLQDAREELDAVVSRIGSDIKEVPKHADDITTWLSAVISYMGTCTDQFDSKELRAEMEEATKIASQLSANAIGIVEEIAKILGAIPLDKINSQLQQAAGARNRKLLSDDGEYPAWMPVEDRRLLAQRFNNRPKPDVVVAADGSGNFRKISDALNKMPKLPENKRYVIYVKAGVYKENVIVDKMKVNIFMYGDGPRKTIVTSNWNYVDGKSTMDTATFAVNAKGFICAGMGFMNTAGPEKHQAVALRVQGDMAAFYNCRFDAYQDTLYTQSNRQFYRNCVISGTVDFIFGDGYALIQNCLIIVRRPMDNQQNIVTAQGRKEQSEKTAIVIQNCRILPDQRLFPDRFKIKTYLARPWKAFSRTIFMESTIGDLIQPAGYMEWAGENYHMTTVYYAEYANRGPGANTAGRVKWPTIHMINKQTAAQFTAGGPYLFGQQWLKYTGAPFFLGFRH